MDTCRNETTTEKYHMRDGMICLAASERHWIALTATTLIMPTTAPSRLGALPQPLSAEGYSKKSILNNAESTYYDYTTTNSPWKCTHCRKDDLATITLEQAQDTLQAWGLQRLNYTEANKPSEATR